MMRRSSLKLVTSAVLAFGQTLASDCVPLKSTPEALAARLQKLGDKAQQEVDRKELANAARDLREAICLAPENSTLHYALGVVEAAAGNIRRTREELEQADRLEPDNYRALAMMVKVNLAAGETDRVKESLRMAAKRFPDDGALHAEFVGELLRNQQYDLALAESLRAEQSGFQEAAKTLAALENRFGAHRDAIRHALAIENQPNLADRVRASAAGIAGLSYEALGQSEESIQQLTLAIQFAPTIEDSYLSLARILQASEKYQEAVQVLEEAQRQVPESPEITLALGSNLALAGKDRESAELLVHLLQRFPDRPEAYVRLAEVYRSVGDQHMATQVLQTLGQREPDYPMIHVMIAQSMLAESSIAYPAILEELAQAEKISPLDPEIYYLRGKIYNVVNQYREATDALRHAIELRPTDPGYYYQLGLVYEHLGQSSLAREQFERMEHLKTVSKPQQP
jgi:tetratricopeptide (TPR) repeat protein